MNEIEIMSIMKCNRSIDVLDWVNYHLSIGIDKITIFDNNSNFSIKNLLKDYDKVEVRELDGVYGFPESGPQNGFNNHCILYNEFCNEKRNKTKWLSMIDNDEYLYIKNHINIKSILDDKYEIISMYWKFISLPSLIEDRDKPVIDIFNYSSNKTVCNNYAHIKSIVNLDKCKSTNWPTPHVPKINNNTQQISYNIDGKMVLGDGVYMPQDFYKNQDMVLYHYFHQSYADWLFKVYRGGLDLNGNSNYCIHGKERETILNQIENKYTELDNSMIERKKELCY